MDYHTQSVILKFSGIVEILNVFIIQEIAVFKIQWDRLFIQFHTCCKVGFNFQTSVEKYKKNQSTEEPMDT